ncbi:hypothetical protein FPOAC2_07801 [Fusarium poae]|uniref:hypothetical protein n=1 Tax=Fusarium poae TaxID=36050 RepID=UPI001CEB0468|nr:hypothetical protein FPOAC1_007894 [Fusarium poae]KAG8668513.1 hypothetical protein FPOAC1_007894 [Fusarium poae]
MESPSQSDPVITVISARYRAAWPELRPLPLVWASDPTWPFPLLEERRCEIEKTVAGIVCRLGIEYEEDGDAEVWLENQYMASQPDTCVPTICIYSSWSVDKQGLWETAVREIALELYHMFKDSDVAYDSIHIDMQSPELGQTIYYEPVTNSDLCDSWDDIRALVNQMLEAFTATRRSMVTIGLFQYGSRRGGSPITIYIAVDYSSDETGWLEVIADIKANIKKHKQGWTDVQVHIEHHARTSYSPDVLPPTYARDIVLEGLRENKCFVGDYQQMVKPGEDFGAESYTHSDGSQRSAGFGTLGCFVEIQRKSSPAWKRYALTSYHAVRPALPGFRLESVGDKSRPMPPEPDSDCWNVDLKGYAPGYSANILHFESPSRSKHNFTIWYNKDQITLLNQRLEEMEAKFRNGGDRSNQESIDSLRARIQIAEGEMQKKIDFFNDGKQMLGTLFAASGYMRRVSVHQDNSVDEHKMRLDWALIDVVEHRQGPNCLPPLSAWEEKYHSAAHPDLTYGELLKDTQSVDPDNSPVWKVGAANGPAIGTYHRNRIACAMVEDSHLRSEDHETSEYIYQPGNHYRRLTYCAKGDSGSIVFNKHGKVIGLYSTGIKIRMSLDNEEFGIVTPIEHIFQDIKDFLGDVTDIRVAID